jgi:uncharacterized membrane protein YkvA (DUF1232 family)
LLTTIVHHPNMAAWYEIDRSVPPDGGVFTMNIMKQWKLRTQQIKVETYALYLAYKDPRTPWYAKLFAAAVVAYAISPIDLIPDFIPVLGIMDDLVIVPLGAVLAIKMVPKGVMAECLEKARNSTEPSASKRTRCLVAATVIAMWGLILAFVVLLAVKIADT